MANRYMILLGVIFGSSSVGLSRPKSLVLQPKTKTSMYKKMSKLIILLFLKNFQVNLNFKNGLDDGEFIIYPQIHLRPFQLI